MNETMDIRSGYGDKVIFSNPDNGHEYDRKLAKRFLEVGNIYTIQRIRVKDSRTEVYLKEIQDCVDGRQVSFNSVLFRNYPDSTEEVK